jgi:hypothetical protein
LKAGAFEDFKETDVKLILPLATLAGAISLLVTSWAGGLSYL